MQAKGSASLSEMINKLAQKKRYEVNNPDKGTVEIASANKPDHQNVTSEYIEWTWNCVLGDSGLDIKSFYFTLDSEDFSAGQYVVQIHGGNFYENSSLTGGETRKLSVLLAAAGTWEHIWQKHMGEFFAVKPRPRKASHHAELVEEKSVWGGTSEIIDPSEEEEEN